MGRKAERGIRYYPTECNHIRNPKVRLLLNDFGPKGYWVWKCIESYAYENTGYYFDNKDSDTLELFATEVCREQVSVVKEIIAGCIRRSLFDKGVADRFNVLSSVEMQEVYLEATAERRRKGTIVELEKDYLLLIPDFNDGKRWENIQITGEKPIVPRKKENVPVSNLNVPEQNTQSKGKEKKGKESITRPTLLTDTSNCVLKDIEVLKAECLNDQINFVDHVCRQNRITLLQLENALQAFNDHLKSGGEMVKQVKDYRFHFQNWLKKQNTKAFRIQPSKPGNSNLSTNQVLENLGIK